MPERPLDCGECKRPVAVSYTQIIGDKITRTVMCAECPHLERKLYGTIKKEPSLVAEKETALACGNCGTTLEEIRMGHELGCSNCYDVFAAVLIDDLINSHKISHHLTTNKKIMPLHVGRAPGEVAEISPTLRLIALNEALDEMLIREDYEQAALLRDQIKTLKEKSNEDNERKK